MLSFVGFLNPAFAKDFNYDVRFLTHEDFVNLYEADQREYIILLRKAAADLSYEDQLSFFQKLNFPAPVWAALLGSQAHSLEYIPPELNTKLNSAIAQAEALLHPVQPNFVDRTRSAFGRMGENLVFGSDSAYLVARDKREAKHVQFEIVQAFRLRNEAVAMISHLQSNQGLMRMRLRESQKVFDDLFNSSIVKYDNKVFRESLREYQRAYESFLLQPMPVAGAIPRPRAGTGVLAGVLGRPEAQPRAPAGSCVRCIYGGFVISNNRKCEAVNSGSEMTAQLGPLQFPPPLKASEMNCEGAKSVLCNPLVFGLKEKGPLCVAPSASATRSCNAIAGTSPESISMTALMLKNNKTAHEKFTGKLASICHSTGTQCYSAARSNDIRQTCAALQERFATFRDKMRLYSPARNSAPVRSAPAAKPIRTTN